MLLRIVIIINIELLRGYKTMTLAQAQRGQMIHIVSIHDAEIRAQAIRFGISAGALVQCSEKIPAGPVIISKGKQEIAIGRRLAENILVQPA